MVEAGHAGLVGGVIGAVTAYIRDKGLGPGDSLPSELALSKELHVSRTVIREAFRSLAAMRLLDLHVGKRARVAQLDHGAMALMIEHGVETEQISVHQIYDVRRTIEVRTASLAALRRSDAEARSILENAQAMQTQFHSPERVMEHDLAFHLAIAKASKNPIFSMIIGAFQGVSQQTWPIGWRSRSSDEERRAMNALHVAIAEAILAGDPQAASHLMAKHFDESVKALLAAGLG
ncbi:FadR family transcriptional regulator [Rhizobium rhizophilum]|uniref:FadR family transcriptional regulator n=1 Tax=Rhizobium rhizophilum TaxID=1850373 RepID=A0ABY2QS60_9HYPH|nr:FadR family transcriptional regulator [Rhizobium rhizophilum]